MKLTNHMRANFVAAIMARVPRKSKWDQAAIIAQLENRLRDTWPDDLADFARKYPQQVNFSSTCVRWLDWKRVDQDGKVTRKFAYLNGINGYLNIENIVWADLREHWIEWLEEDNERKALCSRLTEQVACATTTQGLAQLFPDFAALIPEEPVKTKAGALVPLVGIVNQLKQLGMEVPPCK